MKTKNLILAVLCGTGISTAYAQEIKKETRGDQTYTIYKVQKGETVFSISKKYGITSDKLIEVNPTIAQVIKIGDIVNIPQKPVINPKLKQANPEEQEVVMQYTKHKVTKGQGLMQIARQYNISLDEIKKWNDMDTEKVNIVPDQELIVGISTSKSKNKNNESKNNTANNSKNMDRTGEKPAIKKTDTGTGKSRGEAEVTIQHEVASNENLFKIAQMYGVSQADIMNANNMTEFTVRVKDKLTILNPKKIPEAIGNNPVDANTTPEPQKEIAKVEEPQPIIYTVVEQDNLSKIQNKYNVSRTAIRYWNGMKHEEASEGNLIHVGDHLRIYVPTRIEHIIQKGETKESIKQKYKLNASDTPLEKWNDIPAKKLDAYFQAYLQASKPLIIFQSAGPQVPVGYKEGNVPPMPGLGMPEIHKNHTPTTTETAIDYTKIADKKYTVKEEGQTLTQIANMHGTKVSDIKKWNNLTSDNLKLNQVLIVSVVKEATPNNNQPVNNQPVNNQPAENKPTKNNNFTGNGNNVDLGDIFNQPLPENKPKVEQPKVEQPKIEQPKVEQPKTTSDKDMAELSKGIADNSYNNQNSPANLNKEAPKEENGDMVEKGVAILSNIQNPQPYVATHGSLPAGTIVHVRNINNNKKLIVQIVAKFNNANAKNGELLQLTQAALEKLGAGDAHSIDVEIKYNAK